MQIQFKGTNYELTPEETDLTSRKVVNLKKYLGNDEKEVHAYVSLGKHTEAHQNGDIWFAECKLDCEGKSYFARAQSNTLRSATDKMIAELSQELRTAKRKNQSYLRKSGSRIKEMLRFGR